MTEFAGTLAIIVIPIIIALSYYVNFTFDEAKPFGVINAWAASCGFKVIRIEKLGFSLEKMLLCTSGNQLLYRALIEDSNLCRFDCYLIYGSWILGRGIPRLKVQWISGEPGATAAAKVPSKPQHPSDEL